MINESMRIFTKDFIQELSQTMVFADASVRYEKQDFAAHPLLSAAQPLLSAAQPLLSAAQPLLSAV